MRLSIQAQLDYALPFPADILLQLEAAILPEQQIEQAHIELSECEHFARVAGHDNIGERIWLSAKDRLIVNYTAIVSVNRIINDCANLPQVPMHLLPGETVDYLMPSRFCPSDEFQTFVQSEFAGLEGGQKVIAIREWVNSHIIYTPGSSDAFTTAIDSFVKRQGVCRDFTHVMISLVRAAGIPARFASVYAPGVQPQDFHAVTEVFLGGEWHLMDATGMAHESAMAKIGIGHDAADVAFLTSYGEARLNTQKVSVEQL